MGIFRTIPHVLAVVALAGAAFAQTAPSPAAVTDSGAQVFPFPSGYRNWIYLSSGFDMSYGAAMQMGGEHLFSNVFVDPAAYGAFRRTGAWPDKTVFVLETRAAQTNGSINRHGSFQTRVVGLEAHVKDAARFPGKWAFFVLASGARYGTLLPRAAACYACHAAHGAVDTTFVQFYPTLLPIAQAKGTLRP